MTTTDIEVVYVCHCCIRDQSLSEIVRAEGARVECGYCDRASVALPMDDIAGRIHDVLQAHFELTSSQPEDHEHTLVREGLWERPGFLVEDVIAEIAGVSPEIAADVRELLLDRHGLSYDALKDGNEEPYASDACYVERAVDNRDFHKTWEGLRDEIRSRVRFFSTNAEKALDHIFGDLNTHESYQNKPVICEVSPVEKNTEIWRGRVAQSTEELREILKAPAREIGPPPSRRSEGGRMNASGIPVFYGAFEKDTCIAELRAPVGSFVIMGRFELLRSIKLLDFNVLKDVYVDASHFDPHYDILHARAMFLSSLVREICRPVMPQDEVFEYLPSQVVAEYLANKLNQRLDGIIFSSSQTKRGQNVVLFNHACGVVPDDLPEGTDVKVYVSEVRHDDDDEGDDVDANIHVVEAVTRPCTARTSHSRNDSTSPLAALTSSPVWDEEDWADKESPTWSKPTLRLDIDSIFVFAIRSVRYEHQRREVSRYRRVKDES